MKALPFMVKKVPKATININVSARVGIRNLLPIELTVMNFMYHPSINRDGT